MNEIETLSFICSIIGAVIFLFAINYEFKIIKLLKKIKKPRSWQLATFFTAFFTLGYIVNILSLIFEWEDLRLIFGALVFLFGAVFLVLVILISLKTYRAIFDAAREELGDNLKNN